MSGVAPMKESPVVNHCWRLVRRGDLTKYQQDDAGKWEINVPEVGGET